MKKISIFLLAICLCFSVYGCSAESKPQSAVDKFFKALKACNSADLKATLQSSEGAKDTSEDIFADDTYKEVFKKNAKIIKYKINSTTINGDSAVVKVNCTYGDASEVMGIALKAYMQKALSTVFSSEQTSSEDTNKMLNKEIESALKNTSLKTVTKDLEITCSKVDGKWLVVGDENVANIMVANMYAVLNDMASSFEDLSK